MRERGGKEKKVDLKFGFTVRLVDKYFRLADTGTRHCEKVGQEG